MGLGSLMFKEKPKEFLLEWQDKYRVGIREIDLQHEKLFNMYNALAEAVFRGESNYALGAILDALLRYVVVHFRTEEGYFEKTAYPDRKRHEATHMELMRKTYDIHKDFTAGKFVQAEEVLTFVRNWLTEHTLGMDQQYKPYLVQTVLQA